MGVVIRLSRELLMPTNSHAKCTGSTITIDLPPFTSDCHVKMSHLAALKVYQSLPPDQQAKINDKVLGAAGGAGGKGGAGGLGGLGSAPGASSGVSKAGGASKMMPLVLAAVVCCCCCCCVLIAGIVAAVLLL